MLLQRKNQVKILKNRLFLNQRNEFIRVVSVVKRSNVIKIYNYKTHANEDIEYDTAQYYLTPVFRIGDVAKIVDKKPDTLRKYEQSGIIPKATKIAVNTEGNFFIRVYTLKDVYNLIELFSMRSKIGRSRTLGGVSQAEALRLINSRFSKVKNAGGS